MTSLRTTQATTIIAFCLLHIAYLQSESYWLGIASSLGYVLFLLSSIYRMGLREVFLLTLCTLATGLQFAATDEALANIQHAVLQATFLATFMVSLSCLRESAATSQSVRALGLYLASQPPSKRYSAIFLGGHCLGLVLNFGALSLFAPMIQSGNAEMVQHDPNRAAWRERRQFAALTQGFSSIIAWSPVSVTQATVLTVLMTANPVIVSGLGLACAVGMFVLGWLEDRWTGRTALRALANDVPSRIAPVLSEFPGPAMLRFSTVCALIIVLAVGMTLATGRGVLPSIILVCPLVTILWMMMQSSRTIRPLRETQRRVRALAMTSLPRSSPETITLSAGGYLGVLLAATPRIADSAPLIGETIPPLLLYWLALILIPLCSNLAIPAIVTATFLGTLFANIPNSTINLNLLALALALGWMINLTASPFGATGLILAWATDIKATTLTWHWNLRFSAIALLWSMAFLATASQIM